MGTKARTSNRPVRGGPTSSGPHRCGPGGGGNVRYNRYMPKRLLFCFILALIPLTAAAGTAAPATGLGPQTTGSGGSNADAGSLQPAGTSPLQSSTSSSAGLTAPSNPLQGSVPSSESLQVLAGEIDGEPQAGDGSSNAPADTSWIWLALLLAFGVTGATTVIVRDRRRFGPPTP
jgi:hypothetical protein